MQNVKALFWLGNLDQTHSQHPAVLGLDEEGFREIVQAQLLCSTRGLQSTERQLIDDLIRLFDETLDQFDKHRDYEIRRTVDRLALNVISCVRVFLGSNVVA